MDSSRSHTLFKSFLRNAAAAFCIFLLSKALCSLPARYVHDDNTKQAKAIYDCTALRTAVKLYRLKTGQLPGSLEAIADCFEDNVLPEDPWGNPYRYVVKTGGAFDIICLGADGKPGGEGIDRDLTPKSRFRTDTHPAP